MESKITIEDFQKLELKVGEILEAEPHPNASKLLVLSVDLGEKEPRTIVAGLKAFYEPQDLIGKKAIFVANLEPANLRGIQSNGMILAASNEDHSEVIILTPEQDIDAGSKVK